MSKIVKNTTASPYVISDVGITIPASDQYTIPPQDYPLWAASDGVITGIGSTDLVVNDGSDDLSINDGTKLIQGIFPNPVGLAGSDGTQIENDGDRLKTTSVIKTEENNPIYDGYGRIRTIESDVIYDARFINSLEPLLTARNTQSGGTITRNTNTSTAQLNVTTTNGSRALLQSREYIHYIPGQTYQVYITGRFDSNSADRLQRIGYFDDDNGLYFEYDNGTLYAVTRSSTSGSAVETRIAQSNWNVDPFDGTGPSGINLDPEKLQNFFIDFQWNGSGPRVWGFRVGTRLYFAHAEDSANLENDPWCSTGDLPVRAEIVNTATASNSASLGIQCFSVNSAGSEFKALQTHAITNSDERGVNTSSFLPILSLRLKSDFNRAQIILSKTPVISTTVDNLEVSLILNGSLTGASWTSVGANSIAEYDESATAITGGDSIDAGFLIEETVSQEFLADTLLKIVSDYAGTPDIITIGVKSINNVADARAGFVFKEIF